MRLTNLAHLLVAQAVEPGDCVVDATTGNGRDTYFLADLVGPSGRVFGFDIQEAAIRATADRVGNKPHVTLFKVGHDALGQTLSPFLCGDGKLAAVMFNLGYLPGGSQSVITKAETTIAAVAQALPLLKPRGILTLLLYPGHVGGREETDAVRTFVNTFAHTYRVSLHRQLGVDRSAPELVVIENKTSS